MRTQHVVDEFVAVSDDGIEVTIVMYEDCIPAGSLLDPGASVRGDLLDVQTADGYAVKMIDNNTFEVVNGPFRPGLIVRRG